jgi:TATA-box binding protein (TBP) (component of TFIID and TFIIIB)
MSVISAKDTETFDNIGISTETIIGKTNCKINIIELFQVLPVIEYQVIPKKRGRRPKDEKKIEPQLLQDGDIVTLKLGDKMRGVDLKMKKKSKNDNYFRNSITIVMSCDGKLINFKISKNGKFQFTGCKNDSHSHRCLEFVMGYVNEQPSKKILTLPPNINLEVIYLTVMANINFSLGFCVNKESLDDYVNKNTRYYSLLETTFGYTGVNIKIPLPNLNNIPITKMCLDRATNVWSTNKLSYEDYVALLDDKEKTKEKGKTRYNTFLVFQSGNVILSSPHKECMRDTYHEFLRIIHTCREVIEEKIIS